MDKAVFHLLDAGLARIRRVRDPDDTAGPAPESAENFACAAGLALALQQRVEDSHRFVPTDTALDLKTLGHAARRVSRDLEYFEAGRIPAGWEELCAALDNLHERVEAARNGITTALHPGELGFTARAGGRGIIWQHCGCEAKQGYRQMEFQHESRMVEVLECPECGVRFEKLPERRQRGLVTL